MAVPTKRFKIIHEDEHIFLVDKPAGLLTMPAPDSRAETLIDLVNRHFRRKNYTTRAYLCHRLDRETSGIIILAKGKSTQKIMMEFFKERKIFKEYIAFVKGVPGSAKGVIKHRISGQCAETQYEIVKASHIFSVIRARPLTGRKNQIRLHLQKIGHPILGDRRFSIGKQFPVKFRRVALHAAKIAFPHPNLGKRVSYSTDFPEDMARFLLEHQIQPRGIIRQ